MAAHTFRFVVPAIAILFSVACASPMFSPAENVLNDIIYGNHGMSRSNVDLNYASSKAIAPTIEQAAGIQRSRLGYVQTTGVVTGFTLPRSRAIVVRAIMNGSVSFEGKLASDIEDETERLLSGYSQSLNDFYRREKESLKARAGGGYFCFFQAAANYGYSDDQITRNILDDGEFRDFRDKASAILASQSTSTLSANFSVEIEGRSEGYRETITVFGYVYINQMTLSSGEIFNVAKQNSELVVADQNGDVRDRKEITIEKDNINDSVLDTELSSGRR